MISGHLEGGGIGTKLEVFEVSGTQLYKIMVLYPPMGSTLESQRYGHLGHMSKTISDFLQVQNAVMLVK